MRLGSLILLVALILRLIQNSQSRPERKSACDVKFGVIRRHGSPLENIWSPSIEMMGKVRREASRCKWRGLARAASSNHVLSYLPMHKCCPSLILLPKLHPKPCYRLQWIHHWSRISSDSCFRTAHRDALRREPDLLLQPPALRKSHIEVKLLELRTQPPVAPPPNHHDCPTSTRRGRANGNPGEMHFLTRGWKNSSDIRWLRPISFEAGGNGLEE
jgi:hypothetical protein